MVLVEYGIVAKPSARLPRTGQKEEHSLYLLKISMFRSR